MALTEDARPSRWHNWIVGSRRSSARGRDTHCAMSDEEEHRKDSGEKSSPVAEPAQSAKVERVSRLSNFRDRVNCQVAFAVDYFCECARFSAGGLMR